MTPYPRLLKKLLRKGTPEQVVFFVTGRCNLRCKMCFYINRTSQEEELRLEEIEKISGGMPSFHWLQISGGEPFLRDDLDRICALFVRNNGTRVINIPTNGYFVEKVSETVDRMTDRCPQALFNIGVSLEGYPETHDRITGGEGSYAKAIACFAALKEIQRKHANLGLNFTVTQSKDNEDELKDFFTELMEKHRPDHIAFNLARGPGLARKYTDTSPEKYRDNWNHLLGLVLRRKTYYFNLPLKTLLYAVNMLQKDITYRTVVEDRYLIPCFAARVSCVIDETGNVFPCEMIHDPMGNLRENGYDFLSIWKGEKARNARRAIGKGRCFCSHECFITTNILFNPRLHPRLLSTWRRYLSMRKRIHGS